MSESIESQMLAGLGEVKSELVKQGVILEQVLKQSTLTNGRVSKLEEWQRAVEKRDAHDCGVMEGSATAAITKGQLRAFVAAGTAIAGIAGTVAGIVVRFL